MKAEQIKYIERGIYLAVIIGLVIYGFKDSETAVKLVDLFTKAISFLSVGS